MIRLALFLLLMGSGLALAQDFVAPEAYPLNRYEAGWQKNPFTLKTAPVVMQKDSFAKDLALGGAYQIGTSTKVVVVNTKTRERTHLTDTGPSPEGIIVKSVHFGESRKETFVELACNGDSAVIRYDENLLKQLAAAKPTGKPGAGGAPNPAAAAAAAAAGGQPPMPNPQARAQTGAPVNHAFSPANNPNNTNGSLASTSVRPGTGASSPNPGNIPTPTRRRLNNLPLPIIPPTAQAR